MEQIKFAGIKDGFGEYWALFKTMISGRHASGKEAALFEKELGEYLGVKYVITTNSGSSANLLALSVLNLPKGSKVLTSGVGFPATLNPILHLGLTPVLVDYDLGTQNIDLDDVEEKLKQDSGIKAIIFAHTMGNPVDMDTLKKLVKKYKVYLIEDCCEALGAEFDGKKVGSFGDLATFSFYPTHQINALGMGGAVVTDNKDFATRVRSMRNWGKQAKTPYYTGSPSVKYDQDVDGVKYQEQYVYQTIGFNMQMPDTAAAYARVQLKRLPGFLKKREENWKYLAERLGADMWVHPKAKPAYFGFTILSPDRDKLADHVEKHGIRSRPFFAGNITRHKPYYDLHETFSGGDYLMDYGMFIGVWPGITQKQLDYIIDVIEDFRWQ